jgi:D-threo-aldose 1-dehydrogenase
MDDPSRTQIRTAVAASAQRLKMPRLPPVYLRLRPGQLVDSITAPGGPVDTLVTLRTNGEVGAIGVAGSGLDQLSRCIDLGVLDAVRVHGGWTLLDRSAAHLLDQAVAAGVAAINADVDAGGLLRGTRGGGNLSKTVVRPALVEAARAMDLVCRWWGPIWPPPPCCSPSATDASPPPSPASPHPPTSRRP